MGLCAEHNPHKTKYASVCVCVLGQRSCPKAESRIPGDFFLFFSLVPSPCHSPRGRATFQSLAAEPTQPAVISGKSDDLFSLLALWYTVLETMAPLLALLCLQLLGPGRRLGKGLLGPSGRGRCYQVESTSQRDNLFLPLSHLACFSFCPVLSHTRRPGCYLLPSECQYRRW